MAILQGTDPTQWDAQQKWNSDHGLASSMAVASPVGGGSISGAPTSNVAVMPGIGTPFGLPTSGVGQAPKPMNSIYSPADPRYGNQLFNQNTGAFGASANIPSGGSATGVGGYAPGAAPNLESLTNMINQLNLSGQQASNAGRIPNATGLETQSSGNIGQELAGQVPQDVINLLQQQGAERGVGMGSPGSDNSNAAYLRALGLTSLQQQQLGQQNLSSALARNPGASVFDPTSQLLTPYQAGDLNYKNALLNSGLIRDFLNSGGPFPQGARHYGLANDLNPFDQSGGGTPSWFPTAGGTPAMPNSPISSGGGGFVNDTNYPGTSMPGFPGLTSIIGTPDPGYGLSPDPFGQAPPTDFSNPGAWDFTGDSGFDPFNQIGG